MRPCRANYCGLSDEQIVPWGTFLFSFVCVCVCECVCKVLMRPHLIETSCLLQKNNVFHVIPLIALLLQHLHRVLRFPRELLKRKMKLPLLCACKVDGSHVLVIENWIFSAVFSILLFALKWRPHSLLPFMTVPCTAHHLYVHLIQATYLFTRKSQHCD